PGHSGRRQRDLWRRPPAERSVTQPPKVSLPASRMTGIGLPRRRGDRRRSCQLLASGFMGIAGRLALSARALGRAVGTSPASLAAGGPRADSAAGDSAGAAFALAAGGASAAGMR